MRSRVLGVLLAALVSVATTTASVPSGPASASRPVERSGSGFRCVMDVFGHTSTGRIKFRRVVNSRVTVSRTTSAPVGWRPVSWGLVSSNTWPGHETTQQMVASTDGRVRLVETGWETRSNLRVQVLRVVRTGLPSRLVTFRSPYLYWVTATGSLRRSTWTGKKFRRAITLPVSVVGATTLTAESTDRGMRLYYTDRAGALHVVVDDRARSTDTVLRTTGYRGVTGLETGPCLSPDYARTRSFIGLLSVDRATGVARFQRVLHPASTTASTVTQPVRVPPSDWTWRHLG